MAPLAARQLGIVSRISDAIQSRLSTASVAANGPSTPPAAPTPTVPVPPTSPLVSVPTVTPPLPDPTLPITPITPVITSQASTTSPTPIVSVIIFTTTTGASDTSISTTSEVTSSAVTTSAPISSLVLTTPAPSTTDAPSTSIFVSTPPPASTASGIAAGAGTNAQTTDKGMGGGIIALIVVGALLAALLAGAFTFRRVQVHRRAKRRENNYGAGPIPDAPFPFTNVSEADMKGAEPITRDIRQGSFTNLNEKPLPSIAPVIPAYTGSTSLDFNPSGYDGGMSRPYPSMGAAAGYGYGYGQPSRTASPAPSQAPRMMSPPPPPAALLRTGSPALSGPVAPVQYPRSFTPTLAPAPVPTPAPALAPTPPPAPAPAPASADPLPPHMRGRKRVVQTFQPTLPDELDIRDGDWVTIIHAYDDGWGLCERNGRRGVVPLECLDLGKPDLRASRRLSSLSAIRQ